MQRVGELMANLAVQYSNTREKEGRYISLKIWQLFFAFQYLRLKLANG
jgi:hypothetical protein